MSRNILRTFSMTLLWLLAVVVLSGSFISLCINGQQGYTVGLWFSLAALLVSAAYLFAIAWEHIL